VPVCAPWSALAGYKLKLKVTPGSTKKGRAFASRCTRWQTLCPFTDIGRAQLVAG